MDWRDTREFTKALTEALKPLGGIALTLGDIAGQLEDIKEAINLSAPIGQIQEIETSTAILRGWNNETT